MEKEFDSKQFGKNLLNGGWQKAFLSKYDFKTRLKLNKEIIKHSSGRDPYSSVQCILDTDVAEDKVLIALSQSNGWTLMDKEIVSDPAAVNMVSGSVAANYCVMPVKVEQNRLVLAVRNPYDVQMLEQVKAACNMEVDCVLATKDVIMAAIDRYYPNRASTSKIVGLDTIKPLF